MRINKMLCFNGSCLEVNRNCSATVSLFGVLFLTACAPVPRDFYKPLYNDGTLVSKGCGSSGPQDTVQIRLTEGIKIEMQASFTENSPELANFYFFSTITAPDGVELQLVRDSIIVKDSNVLNSWELKIDYLSTHKENFLGPEVAILERSFKGLSEELIEEIKDSDRETGYIQVPTLSKISGKKGYYTMLFGRKRYFDTGMSFSISTTQITSRLQSFSVLYPDILVNGKSVSLGEILFERVRYIGIAPLNC